MSWLCRNCQRKVEYQIKSVEESVEFGDVTVNVLQKHAYCPSCGAELYPDDLMDENTEAAHEAYRVAKGSITVNDIKALLNKYHIGANPLSKLMGWGENTIERQMKHTVPTKECADQLKRLFDPAVMLELLSKRGDCLTPVAKNKAFAAARACFLELITSDVMETQGTCAFGKSTLSGLTSENRISFGIEPPMPTQRPVHSVGVVFSSYPFDRLVAA